MAYGSHESELRMRTEGFIFKMIKNRLKNGAVIDFPIYDYTYNQNQKFIAHSDKTPPFFRFGVVNGNATPNTQYNRRAEQIKEKFPKLSDDEVFEQARVWVISLIQKITISEYLPIVLGNGLPPYSGYDSSINSTIDVFFGMSSFCNGHSEPAPYQIQYNTPLSDFMNHSLYDVSLKITPVLEAGTSGPFNKRSRDVGIPRSYFNVRKLFGLPNIKDFQEITSNQQIVSKLRLLYKDIKFLDAYVGGLAEEHSETSNLGSLFYEYVSSQFIAARSGDRFEVRATTLRDLISVPEDLIPRDIWHVLPEIPRSNRTAPIIELQCYSIGGWCGFGFGHSMSDAECVISRPTLQNSGYPARPDPNLGEIYVLLLQNSYDPSTKIMSFRFQHSINKPGYQTLTLAYQPFIFASAPFMRAYLQDTAPPDQWFEQHGLNRRATTANFITGEVSSNEFVLSPLRMAHGILIFIAIFLLLPLGIFLKRYRYGRKWVFLHALVQFTAIIVNLISFVVILLRNDNVTGSSIFRAHSIIGILFFILVVLQGVLGSIILTAVFFFINYRSYRTVLALGICEAFLGIFQYYPLGASTSRAYLVWWILYFLSLALWIVIFGLTELNFRYHAFHFSANNLRSKFLPHEQTQIKSIELNEESLSTLSWSEINEEIEEGSKLIVLGSKVYEISQWIPKYPGGSLILNTVLGTDVYKVVFPDSYLRLESFLPEFGEPFGPS
ncbi:hypothetical protein HK098_007583 [Nowakowskiella sp. JEL0407]|nr:hypothetical protein HK098_007583 [Nowakowskiella sp. JEL0407]